ncbi:MAG: hypothetical protein QNJ45_01415 [Ardenticatenaceae bacterium]|nr:hypothetical protein [Ardenticatenaceae bacterium]
MNYLAFGLTWSLPFDCPELQPLDEERPPDVRVCLGDIPIRLKQARPAGPLMQVSPEKVLFYFPGIGRYLVQGGREIIIDPENGVDHQVRLFLLGTVSALLLRQRGLLTLHASGVVAPKGAVLFMGHSGSGKSTLLASFLGRGYPMITDDLSAVAVNGAAPVVLPSFPNMKMWADSLALMGRESAGLKRVRSVDLDKFSVPVQVEMAPAPVPLHAIYVLQPLNETELRLEPLAQAKKFNVFLDHTWQKLSLKRQGRHITHFQQVTAVANRVRVRRAYRPQMPFLLDELTDMIEADFLS